MVIIRTLLDWWSWSIDAWTVGHLSTSPFSALSETSPLRWAKSTARTTSPTRHVYGGRAFAVAGPSAWSSLPDPVRNPNPTEATKDISVRTALAHLTLGEGSSPAMRYTNWHIDIVNCRLMSAGRSYSYQRIVPAASPIRSVRYSFPWIVQHKGKTHGLQFQQAVC